MMCLFVWCVSMLVCGSLHVQKEKQPQQRSKLHSSNKNSSTTSSTSRSHSIHGSSILTRPITDRAATKPWSVLGLDERISERDVSRAAVTCVEYHKGCLCVSKDILTRLLGSSWYVVEWLFV